MIPRDTARGDHAAKRPQNRKYDGADQFPFARLRKIHQNRHRRVFLFPAIIPHLAKSLTIFFFLPTGKVLHDFSVPNEQYSCADPHHKLNIMCDDQKHLALCRKASCQDANLFHAFQIQSAGRFIEHQRSLPQISLTTTARRCICPPERDKGCRSLYASRSTFSNAQSIVFVRSFYAKRAHSAATLSVKSWCPHILHDHVCLFSISTAGSSVFQPKKQCRSRSFANRRAFWRGSIFRRR